MADLDEIKRQKMDLESRATRLKRKINDKKLLYQKVTRDMGDLIYLQARIGEIDVQLAAALEEQAKIESPEGAEGTEKPQE